MGSRWSRVLPVLLVIAGIACSGLVAGPESSTVTPVPASRDSAYVRAKRALQGELFTLDVQDSVGGRLTGTRYPSSNAMAGSSATCRVRVAMQIKGRQQQAEVATTSQWIASEKMSDNAPKLCEQERSEVLERTVAVIVPPPTP